MKTLAMLASGLIGISACKPEQVLDDAQAESTTQGLASKLVAAGLIEVKGGMEISLAYAKDDPTGTINFLKKNVYGDLRGCFLQPTVAAKLNSAQIVLKKILGPQATLVIYDCARPHSVQQAMWKVLPDPRYVGDPARGSKHNFGASVDLSFRHANGELADMGVRFDHFGPESAYAYANISERAKADRATLRRAMSEAGFLPYDGEWWHFDGHPSPRTAFKILNF